MAEIARAKRLAMELYELTGDSVFIKMEVVVYDHHHNPYPIYRTRVSTVRGRSCPIAEDFNTIQEIADFIHAKKNKVRSNEILFRRFV